jgi:hypothetical protein
VNNGAGAYSFSLSSITKNTDEVRLWIAVYDLPKTLAMLEGSNFGKKLTYYNVVSKIDDLGIWDGKAINKPLMLSLDSNNAGFAVIAQNVVTGNIIAAGDVKR